MKAINHSLRMAAVITAGVAVAGLAPQEALAHKTKKATRTYSTETSTRSLVRAEDARISNLEAEVGELRAQLSSHKAAESDLQAKQQQLETQVAEEAAKEDAKNNLVFFRGGFAALTANRNNELLTNNNILFPTGHNGNGNGWYVGAGMDFRATDDLWGATDLVALDAELQFSYMNYGTTNNGFASNVVTGIVGTPVAVRNEVTQLVLSASPKLKFNLLEGNLRPWVIPFGLALNIVSPPSSGVTVLNPGLMLGTGLEYRVWQDIWVGTDFRYQFTGGDLNYKTNVGNITLLQSTPTQGLQAGAYVGIGF
jgi:hypothetical protein